MDSTSELTLRMLQDYDTIAVVGLSTDPTKAAHSVPAAMQAYGWNVIPVNPNTDRLLGQRCYPRLADIPGAVDVVNVFRPSAEAADVARQAVEVGAKGLWLQLGIVSPEARRIADEAGMLYVEDRCIAVERARHSVRRAA